MHFKRPRSNPRPFMGQSCPIGVKTMHKFNSVVLVLVAGIAINCAAITAYAANMTRAECSEAYKAHKASSEYTKPEKGQGNKYWNDFRRNTCGTKANPRKES